VAGEAAPPPTSRGAARTTRPLLPEVSELEAVRHYTRLSQLNFSIDTHFYPLGSCTMKYNPKACNQLRDAAGVPRPPSARARVAPGQGFLACMYELQEMLKEVTGMRGVSLTPMAGAHGEFAGVAMIRAYHRARGDPGARRDHRARGRARHESRHRDDVRLRGARDPGGCRGRRRPRRAARGVGPNTAGIMLTNPSTLGVFERKIEECGIVHAAGGLLYYDGANLNAILGKVRPGDMGFDVIHMNLHKTFSTPHGGGGPGAGAVGVGERLLPFLPIPIVGSRRRALSLAHRGRPAAVHRPAVGLHGQCRRAAARLHLHAHARARGHAARRRVRDAERQLPAGAADAGAASSGLPERRASHEFIITLKRQAKRAGVTAMDFAKRLLDYGFHAPTTYFPLLVPECLLIEPTETESKEALDAFVDAMAAILAEAGRAIRTSC
jgi:glycine dehydrogenase subunit 2